MKNRNVQLLLLAVITLFACRKPKPLDIAIPEKNNDAVVTSFATDNVIVVSAGYSAQALKKLDDTAAGFIPRDLLMDSAVVTIEQQGKQQYKLAKASNGLYVSDEIKLSERAEYKLMITDLKTGKITSAGTQYLPFTNEAEVKTTFIAGNGGDSLLNVHVAVNNVEANDKYFISYTTLEQLRKNTKLPELASLNKGIKSIVSFEPKKIQLIDGNKALSGVLEHSFSINATRQDTMVIQIARIDEGYYNYLAAYKRTGYLINQLTGEPINLPSNIKPGYGYFALYDTKRFVFDLTKK